MSSTFHVIQEVILVRANCSTNPCHPMLVNETYEKYHTKAPIQHTQQPIVTGTSVLGIKFKDGVMLAADTLGNRL
jgi:20S proteasome subunit beta 7